ncbi:hypothetical protein [Aquipuribacter sp. MA13-6]|uniref:hypothetical protein n=1 Tax=unclassified Aquipuribacter TaxID=2635084 RepID=UPI003EF060E9
MPAVDVLDDTFVRAAPGVVRAATSALWSGWLPDLALVVREDRGVKGVRWTARSAAADAPLQGTAEVWLEPVAAGTVVHLYVRLDPGPGARSGPVPRRATGWRARDLPDRLRLRWKRGLHRSKDELEGEMRA